MENIMDPDPAKLYGITDPLDPDSDPDPQHCVEERKVVLASLKTSDSPLWIFNLYMYCIKFNM